jgi:hypothetical protein
MKFQNCHEDDLTVITLLIGILQVEGLNFSQPVGVV